MQIQFFVEEAVARAVREYDARWGGALVVDVSSGEIMAWAQYPFFNPNNYQDFSPIVYRNRLAADALEPGSTFKPFVMAAAIQEHKVTPSTLIDCEGGKWVTKNFTIRDTSRQGTLPAAKVLRYSSNIGMGEAVARWSDVAVLTSDNPRFEEPQAILEDVLPGLKSAREVVVEVDRRAATVKALEMLGKDDALLIAGKGHGRCGVAFHRRRARLSGPALQAGACALRCGRSLCGRNAFGHSSGGLLPLDGRQAHFPYGPAAPPF